MKSRHLILTLCAAALSAVMLTGCGSTDRQNSDSTISSYGSSTTEEANDMDTETVYKATEENVKLLGRTYFDIDRLYCALSGTGFEFTFTGTKCRLWRTVTRE